MIEFQDAVVEVVKTQDKVLRCDTCGKEIFRIKGEAPSDDPETDRIIKEGREEKFKFEQELSTLMVRKYSKICIDSYSQAYAAQPNTFTYQLCKSCIAKVFKFIEQKR